MYVYIITILYLLYVDLVYFTMGSVPMYIWFVTSTSITRFQRKNNNSKTRIQNGKVIIIKATIYVALSIEISVFVEVIAPTYI